MIRIRAQERQRALLTAVAVRWLDRIDDEVAADIAEDELEGMAVTFIDGSDWNAEVRERC